MKDINKLYPALNQTLKSPRGVVLILALTTVLYSGLGLANNSTAALAGEDQIQSSHSTIEISQNTGQFSSYSRIQISQNTNQLSNELPRRIANAILRDASKRSGVAIRELEIAQVTPKTFGNPCEFKFGEVCTREYNPIKGWEAVVEVGDDSWTYHVNKSGSQILVDPKISSTKG
jgi:hypothetical protein